MKSLLKLFPAIVAAVGLASIVTAAPITGTLGITGSAVLDSGTMTATQVTTWDSPTVQGVTPGSVLASTISPGAAVSMASPWTFSVLPTNGLWSVGGFTFDLTSANVYSRTATSLEIHGLGTISGNSYDPTAGTWTFQTNSDFGNYTFGFAAGTTALPDGGTTAMLLGLGLTGLAMLARWRKIA